MKKYSEVAPVVKQNLEKLRNETDRFFSMKNMEDVLAKHNVSSISDLPLDVKAKIMNGTIV